MLSHYVIYLSAMIIWGCNVYRKFVSFGRAQFCGPTLPVDCRLVPESEKYSCSSAIFQ